MQRQLSGIQDYLLAYRLRKLKEMYNPLLKYLPLFDCSEGEHHLSGCQQEWRYSISHELDLSILEDPKDLDIDKVFTSEPTLWRSSSLQIINNVHSTKSESIHSDIEKIKEFDSASIRSHIPASACLAPCGLVAHPLDCQQTPRQNEIRSASLIPVNSQLMVPRNADHYEIYDTIDPSRLSFKVDQPNPQQSGASSERLAPSLSFQTLYDPTRQVNNDIKEDQSSASLLPGNNYSLNFCPAAATRKIDNVELTCSIFPTRYSPPSNTSTNASSILSSTTSSTEFLPALNTPRHSIASDSKGQSALEYTPPHSSSTQSLFLEQFNSSCSSAHTAGTGMPSNHPDRTLKCRISPREVASLAGVLGASIPEVVNFGSGVEQVQKGERNLRIRKSKRIAKEIGGKTKKPKLL
ncbi:hypothetical protein BKA69DRAFT_713169 [Paraphysoderma sedebokerense]|nr:hypothetical protein BKA69DRAFT_713169 [Paraphysoderma sedebokerense]